MSLSSVCVVSNALRLRFFKSKFKGEQGTAPCTESCPLEIQQEIMKETEGETTMKKTMIIEGMMCTHCTGRVEKALSAIGEKIYQNTAQQQPGQGGPAAGGEAPNQGGSDGVVDADYEVVDDN